MPKELGVDISRHGNNGVACVKYWMQNGVSTLYQVSLSLSFKLNFLHISELVALNW